jgi:hypothetical protein
MVKPKGAQRVNSDFQKTSIGLPQTRPKNRALNEKDAIDIWISRWLRIPLKELLARYGCDSRRLYEIWWGDRFPLSRRKATDLFRQLHPDRAERTDFGYRRIPRGSVDASQPDLFAGEETAVARPRKTAGNYPQGQKNIR